MSDWTKDRAEVMRRTYLPAVAYDAYAKALGYLTDDGRRMPEWDELPTRVQAAWVDAAMAMADGINEIIARLADAPPPAEPETVSFLCINIEGRKE